MIETAELQGGMDHRPPHVMGLAFRLVVLIIVSLQFSFNDEVPSVAGPKLPTERELLKVGVFLVQKMPLQLQCAVCGRKWVRRLKKGVRLADDYWQCPEGCNAP